MQFVVIHLVMLAYCGLHRLFLTAELTNTSNETLLFSNKYEEVNKISGSRAIYH